MHNVRNKFCTFYNAFSRSSIPGIYSAESRANRGADTCKFAPRSLPFFFLCLPRDRNAIDSAPVSGKRLHSLDQYLQRDSEFWLHTPSDLAGVSRERVRDSWPTSGDIHKARTLSEHPDAQSRVYGPNVLYGVVNAISPVIHPSEEDTEYFASPCLVRFLMQLNFDVCMTAIK